MVMAEAHIKKWGNSLGIIIPAEIVKLQGFKEGDTVKVDLYKNERIDGFGILKEAPSFEKEDLVHPEF